MTLRTAALAVLVSALAVSASAAPIAHADTTAAGPLTLSSVKFKASVDAAPTGQPVICDGNNFVFCGFVGIELELSGLDSRERPGAEASPMPISTTGTVDVVRVYGCESAKGRRMRGYNTTVAQQDVSIRTRRGVPLSVPAGDTLSVGVYGLLTDAQPGNCPEGSSARLYRLVAKDAKVTVNSEWAGLPASSTYSLPDRVRWTGSAATPEL